MITPADLDRWFTYHNPADHPDGLEVAVARYERLRRAGRELAAAILADTPPGPDQSAAIRKVREAVMTANAAVACGGSWTVALRWGPSWTS